MHKNKNNILPGLVVSHETISCKYSIYILVARKLQSISQNYVFIFKEEQEGQWMSVMGCEGRREPGVPGHHGGGHHQDQARN
jgi:hypothetical protein